MCSTCLIRPVAIPNIYAHTVRVFVVSYLYSGSPFIDFRILQPSGSFPMVCVQLPSTTLRSFNSLFLSADVEN